MAKKPRKEIAPERRDQLVNATLAIVEEVGLAHATLGQFQPVSFRIILVIKRG